MVLVLIKSLKILSQFLSVNLSVLSRNSEYFMSCELHCPRFMDGNVSAVGSDNSLISFCHGIDPHGVGLGSSYEKINLRVFTSAGFADLLPCALTIRIAAISGQRLHIGLRQPPQDLRMCTLYVVIFK